ncbi:MAG: rhodanese-like domain-containing protein [Steroidobacteraceae bacterium]
MVRQIEARELRARLEAGERPVIVDVREAWEIALAPLPAATHVPMGEIEERLGELDPRVETLVICQAGVRSLHVAHYLASRGFVDAVNVAGGIVALTSGDESGIV